MYFVHETQHVLKKGLGVYYKYWVVDSQTGEIVYETLSLSSANEEMERLNNV